MWLIGVLGAIDGCHIPIKAPQLNSCAYINRKSFHSVLLQAVCTADMRFTDCYAGEVGSVHDACVFKRSDLHGRMMTDSSMFPANSHIIGDAAYPLMGNLLVPYKDTGSMTAIKRHYNVAHASARCVIERAFAQLKGRFRRLKYLDMQRIDLVPKVIIACCIVHNVCIENGDACYDVAVSESDVDNAVIESGIRSTSTSRQMAAAKRDMIANSL